MKFRFLLWMLGLLMGKASRTNPAFLQQLGDKELLFQLANPGRQGRPAFHREKPAHHQPVRHLPGACVRLSPSRTPPMALPRCRPRTSNWRSMMGIQDKSIQIKGNPALVIWFQGLTKYLEAEEVSEEDLNRADHV